MRKTVLVILLFSITSYIIPQENSFSNNQLIVKFKNIVSKDVSSIIQDNKFGINTLDKLNQEFKLSKISQIGNKRLNKTYLLKFENLLEIEKVIKIYKNTGLFEYVEPNYIGGSKALKGVASIPNDTWHQPWQWSLFNDGTFPDAPSTTGADISMHNAWDIQQGSSDIIVAVLDSGTFLNHQEFTGRIWENVNEVLDGNDTDGNGLVDDITGWDFAFNDNNPNDVTGHGTNVSGIIGAQGNNNLGYAGIDWNCKLMILKVLDDTGFGYYSWWADAIYYAVDNGANVINMSLAGDNYSALLEDAVNYAYTNNVMVVAATGNNNSTIQYPAKYANSLAIGATNSQDNRANPFFWGGGSNFGPEIDLVAPGDRIYGLNNIDDTDFSWYWGGTSQAAPHVSGVISLLLAENPSLTPLQVRNILRNSADDQVGLPNEDAPGFDIYYGYGRLNAEEALNLTVLGIEDTNNKIFTFYPNPLIGNKLTLRFNEMGNPSIVVFNVLGEKVFSKTTRITSLNLDINLPELDKGVYFLSVLMNRKTTIKKFIKS